MANPPSPISGPKVAAYMRVVPNGAGKNGRVKATLIITPQSPAGDVATDLNLSTWPGDIVKHMAGLAAPEKFPVWYSLTDPSAGAVTPTRLGKPAFVALADEANGLRDLNDLWARAMTGAGVSDPWQTLLADIDRGVSGKKSSADLQPSYQGDPTKAEMLDNGAIVAESHDPTKKTVVKGVVPNPQTGYAIDIAAARAQRVARKLAIGPYLPGDQDQILDTAVPDREKFAEQRKNVLLDRLRASVDGTDPDRQRSKVYFDEVRTALGDPMTAAAPAAAPARTAVTAAAALALPIAPAAQVLGKQAAGGAAPPPSRAAHVYGSWTQWSRQHQQSSAAIQKTSAPGAAPIKPKGPPPDPQAKLLSIYYSLQGDPILSRLFGFAFDIEFDIPNDRHDGGDVWLAAGDPPSSIWTKARYAVQDGEDKTRRFWPAPRLENPDASMALTREQMHGVFDLGQGYEQANPQPHYYLTSLSVRGAVSEALDGIETVDKGERHQTSGWTFLDSGRAARTARDLAVANHQRTAYDGKKAVVLHAEELTIGRRLDVLAIGPKNKNVQWRSLMNRFVEFTSLSGAAKERLDAVAADRMLKGRILDEAAFQLVSRSMPIVGEQESGSSDSRNVEAVVEEAFLSWDGTPLAALTCKSTANGSGSEVLPVKRAYDLPTSDFPGLRPPPLRYGVGYVFSIRSEFLGGGSPTLDEASRWHEAQRGKTTLPPSDDKGTKKPRRFLRQEAIAAPILMLTDNLVTGSNGEMGFESPARAVVRTATPADKLAPGEANENQHGPDHVKLVDRAQPESTMRVFIAPRAGIDFCARHGVFDNAATALQRLGGGLLDVEFHVDKKVQAFPVAVITRNTGFNADRLIYSRAPGRVSSPLEDGDALGATIFHPLRAPVKREGGRSYLPDPAAEAMSLRLRVTGSDKYLKHDVLLELYQNGVDADYPNALPVMVTVEKVNAQRAKPAELVTDVLLGDPKAIVRIREGGQWEPDTPGAGGVRARHLRVMLAPGEQFDLEATCLPSKMKLAQWFSLPENIGVQQHLATLLPAAKQALCVSCGEPLQKLTAAVANVAAGTGLGGYAPPDEGGLGAVAKELLDCVRDRWQLTELAAATTLRVEHAVNSPQNAVSLAKVAIVRPDTSSSPDSGVPSASVAGSSTLLLTGELLVDLEQVDAIDIVAEVVNPGGTPFDEPARSRGVLARRAGRWPTVLSKESKRRYKRKRAVFGFDVDPNGKTSLLRETVTLLRIQNLPDPRAAVNPASGPAIFLDPEPWKARKARLDLGALHWAARNGQPIQIPVASDGHPDQSGIVPTHTIGVSRPHEISDTRARCLRLYAVAVSRSARSFETAPMFAHDGKEHLLHRRQPLYDNEQRKSGATIESWSNATARPAPAAARTPMPFFAIKRVAEEDRDLKVQTFVRKCGVRLRFDRGMFSAGEGERIGIVLWPPDIVKQNPNDLEDNTVKFAGRTMTLSDFVDADLGDGGQYISRWGGDPIRSDPTPQRGWFMPPIAFSCLNPAEAGEPQAHNPKYVPSVKMPIMVTRPPGSTDGTPVADSLTFMQVALLTFEPYFDIEAEEWFVDIAMDAARATDPFIRLGLVRYQPNTVDRELQVPTLQVSTPVRVWTQLPPRRTLTLKSRLTKDGDVTLDGMVCGQASDGIKSLPDDAAEILLNDPNGEAAAARRAVWNRLQRAKVVLKVLHETEDDDFGRRQTNVFPGETIDFDGGTMNDGIMAWPISVTIPQVRLTDLGPGRLVAIVEEIEERLPATYPSEPIKLTDLLKDEVVVQSGPRFIARVPFLDRK